MAFHHLFKRLVIAGEDSSIDVLCTNLYYLTGWFPIIGHVIPQEQQVLSCAVYDVEGGAR